MTLARIYTVRILDKETALIPLNRSASALENIAEVLDKIESTRRGSTINEGWGGGGGEGGNCKYPLLH